MIDDKTEKTEEKKGDDVFFTNGGKSFRNQHKNNKKYSADGEEPENGKIDW